MAKLRKENKGRFDPREEEGHRHLRHEIRYKRDDYMDDLMHFREENHLSRAEGDIPLRKAEEANSSGKKKSENEKRANYVI